jgi:hypothetical protein
VSLPWRDEIGIYLGPRKIALVRRAGGPLHRVIAATEIAVPAGDSGDLDQVLSCLANVACDPAWQNARVRAVVADHPWARYGIVPWPSTRLDAAGRLTHARYLLADTYGEEVAGWAVTLADTPPGRSYLACAIPSKLRTACEEALAPARLTLCSLQPQLITAFNSWRHRLPADDAWFVSVVDGAMSALHLARGAWDRVHLSRLPSDWGVELERLQAFGRLTREGYGPVPMFVDAPSWMRRSATQTTGVEWLEEDAGKPAQAHELALLQRMYV